MGSNETDRAATAGILERASGQLATATIDRMEAQLPWFRAMPPKDRSWIGLVAQTGIAAFISWFREPTARPAIASEVLGTAPRELTRKITLHQTVELVRACIEVVEEKVPDLVPPEHLDTVREAVLRYSREIAFGAAEVYARAAELRGAWDARLEALVVDSVLRGETDESLRSRVAALGWAESRPVIVVAGNSPTGDSEAMVDLIRRDARHSGLEVLTGVQGERLVVVLGGIEDPERAATAVSSHFGTGPVVFSRVAPDLLSSGAAARAAVAGLRAAPAWPDAPRPVCAEDLLPERALSGDGHARRQLVTDVFRPLEEQGPVLLETLAAFFENGNSVEATARMLFVHANTVRYRMRRISELTDYSPSNPRHSYTLRVALTLGRLHA